MPPLPSHPSAHPTPSTRVPSSLPFSYPPAQSFNKALQAPGRALSTVIAKLKPCLPADDYTQLAAFHSLTVACIPEQAASAAEEAAGGGSEGGAAREKLVELRTMLPALKAIVGKNRGQKNEGDA